ncbi:uncharacterized protein BO96DRAFT_347329 [Aspergillus niger CBS 101883]|uniref:Uncharacterized protein n=2 Tax=Aspergillus niger TaxID=5061 RepID=A2QSE3_ASPNC|nr:uncharacterized protein BO96DRAFT_347329 [Aspergillus niger CBS 101883]XP_059604157.1 hypothetical protein An08g10420 [Aspergillus niger]PYH52608.1 hypothetical protein BO96DRAFT_347329 [Aspergillus niger CBS 101883]CAK45715.1 hypothetical protein An08g10420 [Aspergillus niger]
MAAGGPRRAIPIQGKARFRGGWVEWDILEANSRCSPSSLSGLDAAGHGLQPLGLLHGFCHSRSMESELVKNYSTIAALPAQPSLEEQRSLKRSTLQAVNGMSLGLFISNSYVPSPGPVDARDNPANGCEANSRAQGISLRHGNAILNA